MTDRGDTFTEYAVAFLEEWRAGADLLVRDVWTSERLLTGLAHETDPEIAERVISALKDIQVQLERSGDAAQGALTFIERRSKE